LPAAFNSTALTALEPMSRPTTDFDLLKPNTDVFLGAGFSSARPMPRLDRGTDVQIRM
jgi:hypothetical protein